MVLLPVALVPLIVLVMAACRVSSLARTMDGFQNHTLHEFTGYLDSHVANCGTPPIIQAKLVTSNSVHVSWWGHSSASRLEARIPIRWTASQGLRTVSIEWLSLYILDDPQNLDRSKYYLRDRASLDRLLTRIGASAELQRADWQPEPPDTSDEQTSSKGPVWTATCTLGGVAFTPRAQECTLEVKPCPSGWVP
jgi:hypothetical protein